MTIQMIHRKKYHYVLILFVLMLIGCQKEPIPDPIITLLGDIELTVEAGSMYIDEGATAIYDGKSIETTVLNEVDTAHVGTYTLDYCVMIDEICKGLVHRVIHVVDTTAPEISLTAASPIVIEYGSADTLEQYVMIEENHDMHEDLVWTFSKSIDYTTVGSYRVFFSVTDQSHNKSNTLTCTIIIEDNQAPNLALADTDPLTLEAGFESLPYDKFIFSDNYDDVEHIQLIVSSQNPMIIGEQIIQVVAIDSSGNQSLPVDVTLILTDETPPVLAFSPLDDFTHEIGFPYTEDYLTLYDNFDAFDDIKLFTTGEVDYNTKGEYIMSYYAEDSQGNVSQTISKTVTVVDRDDSLSDIERYLKDHTSLYDLNKFVNQYLYDPMEQCYRGLILNHYGTYDVVYFFFLYNFQDDVHVLRKIEFVNPNGQNLVFVLNDDTHDYVFEIPVSFAKDTGQITIYTYPHEDYQTTVSSWTGIFSFNGLSNLDPSHMLTLELHQGNLK